MVTSAMRKIDGKEEKSARSRAASAEIVVQWEASPRR